MALSRDVSTLASGNRQFQHVPRSAGSLGGHGAHGADLERRDALSASACMPRGLGHSMPRPNVLASLHKRFFSYCKHYHITAAIAADNYPWEVGCQRKQEARVTLKENLCATKKRYTSLESLARFIVSEILRTQAPFAQCFACSITGDQQRSTDINAFVPVEPVCRNSVSLHRWQSSTAHFVPNTIVYVGSLDERCTKETEWSDGYPNHTYGRNIVPNLAAADYSLKKCLG